MDQIEKVTDDRLGIVGIVEDQLVSHAISSIELSAEELWNTGQDHSTASVHLVVFANEANFEIKALFLIN